MQIPGREEMTWVLLCAFSLVSPLLQVVLLLWSCEGKGTSYFSVIILASCCCPPSLCWSIHSCSYLIFATPWEVGIICLFYRRRNWGTCLSHSAGDWQSQGRAGVLPRSVCSHGTCLTLKPPASTDWFDLGLALPELVQKSKTVTFLLAQSPSPSGHKAKSWVGLGNKPRSHFQ